MYLLLPMTIPSSARAEPLDRLAGQDPLISVELRPPRADLSTTDSMDTWIDMHHSLRRLAADDTIVFITDNAVGQSEEENLQHLTTNLAGELDPAKIVPFLTCKHSLDYCLMYAKRAASRGIRALAVLGGDKSLGAPRCVPHAFELRRAIREQVPSLRLGGWVNTHRDPSEQVDFVLRDGYTADFYLTQIVSHHTISQVEQFLAEATRREVPYPGVFGVFYYRSANPKTLERLSNYFPVPARGIARDFESGLTADEICALTIRALRDAGARKIYLSNLGFRHVYRRYECILSALNA